MTHTEIFDSVEIFYRRFYFRPSKIAAIVGEMTLSPEMMRRRLREGAEFSASCASAERSRTETSCRHAGRFRPRRRGQPGCGDRSSRRATDGCEPDGRSSRLARRGGDGAPFAAPSGRPPSGAGRREARIAALVNSGPCRWAGAFSRKHGTSASPDQVFGLAWSGPMTSARLAGLITNLPEGVSRKFTSTPRSRECLPNLLQVTNMKKNLVRLSLPQRSAKHLV